jgi:activating signal cointegrator 1
VPDLLQTPRTIKAISLWQPWASLVAAHVKRHETRHWATDYRGPIAIHAAKTIDVVGAPDRLCVAALGEHWARTVPIGMIVAVGQMSGCTDTTRVLTKGLTAADLAAGNFTPGRYAWTLRGVRALRQPIPAVGRQGLFNWEPPEDLESRLAAATDHVAACRYIGWA